MKLNRQVVGVFLCAAAGVGVAAASGCLQPAARELNFEQHGFDFEQYEVVTGSATRQTVLTGFLLGGAVAELAVVSVDVNERHRLRIYAFDDGQWVSRLEATLGSDVLFVDVAGIGGRDRLRVPEQSDP